MTNNILTSDTTLGIKFLQRGYSRGDWVPRDVIKEVYRRISAQDKNFVWEYLVPEEEALSVADKLSDKFSSDLPLFGIPFSVKDNIHVEGMPTSASCPAYAHFPDETAPVVRQLLAAGAIIIGKNVMDQFATGLVGTRSEVFPPNPFNPEYIPGGSSSGSAVAVTSHLVSFALGSDTGGSGRVPAALNNIVGFKPTPSAINTCGMVYANRSFDCIPIFSLSCEDAAAVFDVMIETQKQDPFVSPYAKLKPHAAVEFAGLRIGIPNEASSTFFDDLDAEHQFDAAIKRMGDMGAKVTEFDFTIFKEAGDLIFDGALLAERLASIGPFIQANQGQVNETVKKIVSTAGSYSAVDLYHALHRLQEIRFYALSLMENFDCIMLPTVGTEYKIVDVLSDPVRLNKNMGYYTYFANPIGLPVIAVPASMKKNGIPFGISLVTAPLEDRKLLHLGRLWQGVTGIAAGLS